MTDLTIGRVGFDVAFSEVEDLGLSGDSVSLSGVLVAGTLADVKVLRQQLNGYVNNGDEEVVPVTWVEDPTLDGYYRVTSVEVSTVPASYNAFWFPFRVTLDRVPGYAGPLMETVITSAVRTNSHSITNTTAVAVCGVPDVALEFYDTANPSSGDLFTREADGGDMQLVKADPTTAGRVQQFALEPKDWYVGACRVELGTSYRVAVGQQIPSERDTWRLSNGLLRVRPFSGGFTLSCYDAGLWSAEKQFQFTFNGATASGLGTVATGLRVLRNAPEECIIRLPVALAAAGLGTADKVDIDLALRRGDRLVRGFLAASLTAANWGVECVSAEAATALTGGIRATSNDSAGNRFVLTSPVALTNDLTQGGIEASSTATSFSFAAGLEVNGSTAATNDAAQQLIYQYMSAVSERVVVGSR